MAENKNKTAGGSPAVLILVLHLMLGYALRANPTYTLPRHPQHQPLQIRPLRKTQQHRMVGAGVQVMGDLRIHAGVERRARDDLLEQAFADTAGAGAGGGQAVVLLDSGLRRNDGRFEFEVFMVSSWRADALRRKSC
jgi:hypothetical protein